MVVPTALLTLRSWFVDIVVACLTDLLATFAELSFYRSNVQAGSHLPVAEKLNGFSHIDLS